MNNYGSKNVLYVLLGHNHVLIQTFLNVIVQTHNYQSSESSQQPDNPSVSLLRIRPLLQRLTLNTVIKVVNVTYVYHIPCAIAVDLDGVIHKEQKLQNIKTIEYYLLSAPKKNTGQQNIIFRILSQKNTVSEEYRTIEYRTIEYNLQNTVSEEYKTIEYNLQNTG